VAARPNKNNSVIPTGAKRSGGTLRFAAQKKLHQHRSGHQKRQSTMPQELNDWVAAAAIDRGRLFRRVNKGGRAWGDGMTVKAVWQIVKESARSIGVSNLAPHDLRRTCARLCHASGGELEQIQFLLGRVSVQTTERYLGCKQRIRSAVNDRIGIEPDP
jgi:integrase